MKCQTVETASHAWAPCGAPSLVRAVPKRSLYSQPPAPPSAGGVGSYNHLDIGEEVEWRPPLLYANPLGHRLPAALFIARVMRNNMSEDHYEVISEVALGVNRPGGGCTGCMGVNIAWTPW